MLPFRFYRSRQCFVHLNYCYTYNNKHSYCKSRKETRFNNIGFEIDNNHQLILKRKSDEKRQYT